MIKPVSSTCNMECRYCFYADVASQRETKNYGIMSDETLENIVRRAMAYADTQIAVSFQGGEPLLAGSTFYKNYLDLIKKYNTKGILVQNAIQTNGYEMDDSMLDVIERGHFLVGVSYDGTDKIHDLMRPDKRGGATSSKVKKTLEKLKERKVAFNILCVVTLDLALHAEECFENLSQYGFIQYIPCLNRLDGSEEKYALTSERYLVFLKKTFDLYYEAYLKGAPVSIRNFDNYIMMLMGRAPENCGMSGQCGHYFLIESDGSVYPCDFYVLDEWRIGNINDRSFFKLEKATKGAEFIEKSLPVPGKCRKCKWYALCRNGCRREREPYDDDTQINKWCSCYQAFFEYAFDRMCRMAEQLSHTT